jgi:hypothetical protein
VTIRVTVLVAAWCAAKPSLHVAPAIAREPISPSAHHGHAPLESWSGAPFKRIVLVLFDEPCDTAYKQSIQQDCGNR